MPREELPLKFLRQSRIQLTKQLRAEKLNQEADDIAKIDNP
jgi:hypothetical protein